MPLVVYILKMLFLRSGTPTARGKWRRIGDAVRNVFPMSMRTRWYRLFAQRTRVRGLSAIRTRPNFRIFQNLAAVFPSHFKLVPSVGRMSPIPWNRILRGGRVVHSNFFWLSHENSQRCSVVKIAVFTFLSVLLRQSSNLSDGCQVCGVHEFNLTRGSGGQSLPLET